jgi:acyl carrier protein
MDDGVRTTIRQFILTTFLPDEPPESLRDDTPLQTSGILDSLAVYRLSTFIEQEFGITLSVRETTAERFDRINDIAMVVRRHLTDEARA